MKTSFYIILAVLLTTIMVSCGTTGGGTIDMLKPGDKIRDMTVQNNARFRLAQIRSIWSLCGDFPEETKPGIRTLDCNVPVLPWIYFDIGWYAESSALESNWEAMTWEMYIDEYQVDLDSFGWIEIDDQMHGETAKARIWLVTLLDPSPGKHVIRYSWTSQSSIDDGLTVYAPGTYEFVVNFTVVETE